MSHKAFVDQEGNLLFLRANNFSFRFYSQAWKTPKERLDKNWIELWEIYFLSVEVVKIHLNE
jgi:hypothetical protein